MVDYALWIDKIVTPAQLFTAMLGMGATLALSDFAAIAKRPTSVAVGLFLQWCVVPLLALFWTSVIDFCISVSPALRVGIILVACVPAGALSNLITFVAKGSVVVSIALTIVATLLCTVATPALVQLLGGAYLGDSFSLDVSYIVVQLLMYAIFPLALGMWIRSMWPVFSERMAKHSIRLSFILLAVLVGLSMFSGRIEPHKLGWITPAVVIGFYFLILTVVPIACLLFRRSFEDSLAITIEVVVRNASVAVFMVPFFFVGNSQAQSELFSVVLLYGGLSVVFAVPCVVWGRRRYSAQHDAVAGLDS